jgi:peptidoglycan/LPS O-acetylase OafA/YrhL
MDKFRSDINGLRALAVIAVIVFHYNPAWLRSGFLGVDVFFVISGYLISGNIFRSIASESFSLSIFYLKRVKRILPALAVVVVVSCLAGRFLLYSLDAETLGTQGLAALFSFANISFWLTSGSYWGQAVENSPLLHSWSLSLEEQFYLIFPLFLLFLQRKHPARIVGILIAVSFVSLVLFLVGTKNYANATFYLLPMRIWELSAGAWLSWLHFKNPERQRPGSSFLHQVVSCLGGAMIICSFFLAPGKHGVSWGYLIPVLGTLVTIHFSAPRQLFHSILSSPAFAFTGLISYSLYLWHWPVLVFSKNWYLNGELCIHPLTAFTLILILSIASYFLVEKPLRFGKRSLPLIASIFATSVGAAMYAGTPVSLKAPALYNPTVWNGELYDNVPNSVAGTRQERMAGLVIPRPTKRNTEYYNTGGVQILHGKPTPEIVLLGDSHGLMWSSVLNEIAGELGTSASFYPANQTSPFFTIPPVERENCGAFTGAQKMNFEQSILRYLRLWKPKLVIISSIWRGLSNPAEADDLLDFLESNGCHVLLIEQPPELFYGDRNAPEFLAHMGLVPNGLAYRRIARGHVAEYENGRETLRHIANIRPNVDLVLIADLYMENGMAAAIKGRDVLYIDDDHLSEAGAGIAKPRLKSAIVRSLSLSPQ